MQRQMLVRGRDMHSWGAAKRVASLNQSSRRAKKKQRDYPSLRRILVTLRWFWRSLYSSSEASDWPDLRTSAPRASSSSRIGAEPLHTAGQMARDAAGTPAS